MDIALLKEVEQIQPYSAPHGKTAERWEQVTARFNNACAFSDNKEASTKNCQARFTDLVKKFKQEEMESLRASGTEEEYSEREQLLTDLVDLMKEAEDAKSDKKRKKAADDDLREVNGAKIRDVATKRLKQKSTAADDNSDDDDDGSKSSGRSSTTSSRSRSGTSRLIETIGSLADMLKNSNAADAASLKSSTDAAAKDRQLKKKELELHERKLLQNKQNS
ncbi:UNVERIFIED_CONTAM: hypothetical protein HDU68_002645 [Siphonaria sp. JEL0065]|nr:hypothetical protein HDU68_002645 [Siphonaria sp. JEL0065]